MIIIIYFHYDHFLVRSRILGAIVSFWLIIIQHFKLFLPHVRFSTLINNWEVFVFYVLDIRQNGDLNTLRSTSLILVLTFELMMALKRFDSSYAYEINSFIIMSLCKKSIKFPSFTVAVELFSYQLIRVFDWKLDDTFHCFYFLAISLLFYSHHIYSVTKHLLLASAKCNNYMSWYTYRSSVHKALQLFIG